MSDRRANPDRPPSPMSDDLRALADVSSRNVPVLGHSVTAARALRGRVSRQRWASVALAAVAVVGFLVVPIPYERTTAHDVELAVSGPIAPSLATTITNGLKTVLGAREVAVTPLSGAAGEGLTFASRIPVREGVNVEEGARALAAALERIGHVARATIVPRRERVSGSVYAFARDHVFRVRGEGRTAPEIEAELRRRFEEEGLGDAKVSVTDEHGMRQIHIERPESGPGTPATIGIGLDGAMGALDASATQIEVKRVPTARDGVILHVDLTWKGRQVAIDVPHSEAMSEAALGREIESRLKAAGIDGKVRVSQGAVQIEARR